ncbi:MULTISPECIES: helix-turn-helix domain-containing protein [Micromonospora]|uniref:DNA-binding protein n=1 Tax=Micromonospora maris TaxID=1003110 RepID=A0A9X0LFX3_9ACTN|nr:MULTISPECIES: helix-turn-helix transcriptional regulator [Micromonospora]AEB43537.1 helix-turn-helix domain protein [Micromonospora maris AB-18-032]KUJ48842.1 DNA-binding protein [Micromonospora maris]RUL92851.1 XRE family transcriptional regulator [Verrucosispora sp. FIM060022]
MVLLRRVIGDALRARRQGQHRTLREVSSAANVSLGYLSEIERGQKEPSSELLAAICDALGARLSELLREVSDTVALAEQLPGVLVPMQDEPAESTPVTATVGAATNRSVRQVSADGVAVSVRQESPLKATLRSTRVRPADRTDRDVVCAA